MQAERIQPTYCLTPAECLCQSAYDPRAGLFEGTLADQPDAEPGVYVRVDVIHRQTDPILPPVAVGDVLSVSAAAVPAVGTRVLLTHSLAVAAISDADTLGTQCLAAMNRIDVKLPALTKTEAVALLNGDYEQCIATLNAREPAWNVEVCEGCQIVRPSPDASTTTTEDAGATATPKAAPAADDSGCSVSLAGSSPESVSVLLAVLSALAARRWVRRRSAG